MRVKTYILIFAGFVLAATAHKSAEPLKQRLAEKGGVIPATTNSGIIDKAVQSTTSHITLAQASNDLRSGVMSTTMNAAAVTGEASSKTNAKLAAGNLRSSLTAEAHDCEDNTTSSGGGGSNLRGVYGGSKVKSVSSRRESPTKECSRSRSRSPGSISSLSRDVKFRGSDLDSVFGKRVFGKPSVQAPNAPSVSLGRGATNGGSLSGTQIPSADIHMESNRALGFHLQPDVQMSRNEESASVSAEETHREGCTKGAKYRHFAIKGDIVVSEQVTFKENAVEEEKTAGRAAKNTVAAEQTDVGDILSGPQDSYVVETRSPLEYTLQSDRLESFPPTCSCDAECEAVDSNFVCGYPDKSCVENSLRGSEKVCIPRRGNDCDYKKLSSSKYCEIDGVEGKCTFRDYCVPLSCRNDDDCKHDGLYFCKRTKSEMKNGKKGKCALKTEF